MYLSFPYPFYPWENCFYCWLTHHYKNNKYNNQKKNIKSNKNFQNVSYFLACHNDPKNKFYRYFGPIIAFIYLISKIGFLFSGQLYIFCKSCL